MRQPRSALNAGTTSLTRAAFIIRNSREAAVAGWSTERQEREQCALGERRGWKVVEVIAVSGQTGSSVMARDKRGCLKRPDIARIIELARAGLIDVACAADHDRWGRNDIEFEELLRLMRGFGVTLWTLNGPLEDADYRDWKERREEAFDATKYSRKTSDRTRRGHAEAAKAGRHAKTMPYGVRPSSQLDERTGRRVAGVPEPDPAEWPWLLLIFEWGDRRGEALNNSQICRRLRTLGAPTATGRGRWMPNVVSRIRANRFYLGEIYKRPRSGAPYEEVYGPRELACPDALHQCRIERDLWEANQPLPGMELRGRPLDPAAVLFGKQLVAPALRLTKDGQDYRELRYIRGAARDGRKLYQAEHFRRDRERWSRRPADPDAAAFLRCQYDAEWLDELLLDEVEAAYAGSRELTILASDLHRVADGTDSLRPDRKLSVAEPAAQQVRTLESGLMRTQAALEQALIAGDMAVQERYAVAAASIARQLEEARALLSSAGCGTDAASAKHQRLDLHPAPSQPTPAMGEQLYLIRELRAGGHRAELAALLRALVPRVELHGARAPAGDTHLTADPRLAGKHLAPILFLRDTANPGSIIQHKR